MKKSIFALAVLVLCSGSVFAAKYAGEFLELGVGARGIAMGGAMASHTFDGSSFYWNPAGMGYVTGIQATGMYADLWDGLANFSSTGITLPVTGSVFAINYVRLGVPDIQNHPDYDVTVQEILARAPAFRFVVVDGDTIYINSVQEYLLATGGAPAGLISDNESAIFFTFAKYNQFTLDLGWSYFTIPLEMPVGVNLKLLNNKLGSSSGTGIGADAGIQFRFPLDEIVLDNWRAKLCYGVVVKDLTRTELDWGEGVKDAVPTNLYSSIAIIQKMPGRNSRMTLAYETEQRYERRRHFGVEYNFENVISLRGGMWQDEWSAGAGVNFWRMSADYAYYARDLGTTHRVSVSIKIK
ncbi:MAG: hypothetical protein KDB65_06800 [Calditrichaeota bacterium]|nr:hypothetical protein [Calditrichota bacterium]MCB9369698.1 hypothetical protein [Calditrichota bacterium]